MRHVYSKSSKIKYNNQLFRIFIRSDRKYAFMRIKMVGDKETYEYPTAQEFLHLTSVMNTHNRIKF